MSKARTNWWAKLLLTVAVPVNIALGFYYASLLDIEVFTPHEYLGVAAGLAMLIHVIVNWRGVVKFLSSLFGKAKTARAFAYVVAVLTILVAIVLVASGIRIGSTVQGPLPAPGWITETHHIAGTAMIAAVALHWLVHWRWFRKLWSGPPR